MVVSQKLSREHLSQVFALGGGRTRCDLEPRSTPPPGSGQGGTICSGTFCLVTIWFLAGARLAKEMPGPGPLRSCLQLGRCRDFLAPPSLFPAQQGRRL